jgi:hypothetical protein
VVFVGAGAGRLKEGFCGLGLRVEMELELCCRDRVSRDGCLSSRASCDSGRGRGWIDERVVDCLVVLMSPCVILIDAMTT